MNLEYYIQQLLFSFDCVIIPNFGGIVAQPINASLHSTQHIFYPPKKQLAFNRNLNKSDGLLINHVALNQNLSYDEAAAWVENEVNSWMNELRNNAKLSIAEVGRFLIDKEQNIQFEPASFINYNPDAFGCTSFHFKPVDRQKTSSNTKNIPKFIAIPKVKFEKKGSFKKILAATVAIPILFAAIYIPTSTNLFNKGYQFQYSSFNPFSTANTIQTKYSERIITELPKQYDAKIEIEENTETNKNNKLVESVKSIKVIEPIVSNDTKSKIHLIVGSFATQENANELIATLKSSGYDAYVQGKSASGLIRVSCKLFGSKEEASAAKNNVKQQGLDAWILQE